MAKQTIEQTVGLCKEAMTNVRNAYDRGYKQGYKDGEDIEQKNGAVTKAEVAKMEYERGLNDAWEAARRIMLCKSKGGLGYEVVLKIFQRADITGTEHFDILHEWPASEAVVKIKKYEEKQKQAEEKEKFKVGDEVISDARRFIVLGIDASGWYNMWCLDNGLTYDNLCSKDLTKTGRSFPQLAELFKQMKEG